MPSGPFPKSPNSNSDSSPLISPQALAPHLGDPNVLVIDCEADIRDAAKGRRDYEAAHIPGASSPNSITTFPTSQLQGLGRHPLPSDAALSAAFSRWNLTPDKHVVACDDAQGALAAARLWWLLRLAGHKHASVLDGGLAAWRTAGLPLESGAERHARRVHRRHPRPPRRRLDRGAPTPPPRRHHRPRRRPRRAALPRRSRAHRQESRPHSGALNRPFSDNLDANGRFKSREHLRGEVYALIGVFQPWQVVHMCGSGVTACHNLLAMEAAGMQGSRCTRRRGVGGLAIRRGRSRNARTP